MHVTCVHRLLQYICIKQQICLLFFFHPEKRISLCFSYQRKDVGKQYLSQILCHNVAISSSSSVSLACSLHFAFVFVCPCIHWDSLFAKTSYSKSKSKSIFVYTLMHIAVISHKRHHESKSFRNYVKHIFVIMLAVALFFIHSALSQKFECVDVISF